jgi:hypothetical protein
MPIEGLGVDGDDDGLHVTYQGVPFVQISTAEQLRVSTAIAMAGNPELRILRISDGALLDDNSMAILRDMATEHDFQLFVELVRPNEATGIILEDGRIKGQELEPQDRKPARAKKAEKPEPDTPETVAEKASAGRKVIEGLQDAIAYANGDESKGTAHHVPTGAEVPPLEEENPLTAGPDIADAMAMGMEGAQSLFETAPAAAKVWSQEEWDALPAARRAFLTKRGEGPAQ